MIYYKDKVEMSYLEFKNKLGLEVATTFGISDVDNIEELTLMLLRHMALSYKEVLMGGHSYQILVHPIVYVDRPVPFVLPNGATPRQPNTGDAKPIFWMGETWCSNETTSVAQAEISSVTNPANYKGGMVIHPTSMTREEYELNSLIDKVVK